MHFLQILRRIALVTEDFDKVRRNISKGQKHNHPHKMRILKKSPASIENLNERSKRTAKKIMEINKNFRTKVFRSKIEDDETVLPKDDRYYYTYTSDLPEIQDAPIIDEVFR